MKKAGEILPHFTKLNNQSSLNLLIEKTYKMAFTYLKYNHKRLSKIFLINDETFETMAISAIAPLFCKEYDDSILPIVREFNAWQPSIKTDEDAIFFLNTIISGRVEQHISVMLKEHDPFFSKILHSINYIAKKNGYKRMNHFGQKYIVDPSCEKIESKTIDFDSFQKLPFELFSSRETVIPDILNYIKNETDFYPAIPVNPLVIRLRNMNSSIFLTNAAQNEAVSDIDISEIINVGLSVTFDKLKMSYLNKGKLTHKECEAFMQTLHTIAQDLKDGGINRGLYDYLLINMPELDKEDYKNKYHNTLEYLVRVMKNTIKQQIMDESE